MSFPKPLLKLIEEFQKFPSVGPKSAQRMAFHVLNRDLLHVEELSKAILNAKIQIKRCLICQNLSADGSCEICSNTSRNTGTICVVSEPKDLMAIERTNAFRGTYHVLGGLISPLDGIGPENLSITELLKRVSKNNISEIILALDTSVEGEATTLYLHRILSPVCKKITRLGFGLPAGSELEYADELTLIRALETRSEVG
ncbi:MAG: recombination protein RecR [Candidatus Melainabacteria bacterium RIFCSPLOWO2_02_FULL_35_15]|nr:MAG: recombination protein RecR [Candidatus Melainabacteria bacterium RIFCSPLOWO2_12_FULL_35_11]OGI13554.1 MAG: recombination protein RecR [Candidatus Melainabacteria bacterium RIFCSPLOWO2_02_FULL_35_15]